MLGERRRSQIKFFIPFACCFGIRIICFHQTLLRAAHGTVGHHRRVVAKRLQIGCQKYRACVATASQNQMCIAIREIREDFCDGHAPGNMQYAGAFYVQSPASLHLIGFTYIHDDWIGAKLVCLQMLQ